MTLNQLENAVAALGFESEIEDTDSLVIATNRALRMIFSERPVTKREWISVALPPTVSRLDTITHNGGELKSFPLTGKAYSFLCFGKGSYSVTDSGVTREANFDGNAVPIRGFINGNAEISFKGDYFYKIHSLTCFSEITSAKEDDIPIYEAERAVCISEMLHDFFALESLPTGENGETIKCASLADGKIYLPWEFEGKISIEYRRTPTPVSKSTPDVRIDLPEECSELLPLLVASFMWYDDDAERSQYYMALYKNEVAKMKRYSPRVLDTAYQTNGWA